MTGTTHAVVGAATALTAACLVSGSLNAEAGASIAIAGMAGGVLADIDLKQSKAAQWTRRGIAICVVMLFLVSLAQFMKSGRVTPVGSARMIGGMALFICLAIVGMKAPHREKTHSFVFLCGFSVAVFCITDSLAAAAFALGYFSHLVIDFPNKKGECLLWPLPKRFCLGLCGANGIVSKCLCFIGCVVCLVCTSR